MMELEKLNEKIILMFAEKIKENESLKDTLDGQERRLKNLTYESGINSAMLADICEVLFGGNANGSPSGMSYNHANWVCGITTKSKDELFVEYFYRIRAKRELVDDSQERKINEEIEEWRKFIDDLRKLKEAQK